MDIYEGNQVKLLIDFSSRILRKDNMYDFIRELRSKRKNKQFIQKKVKGRSVIASYGNYRFYRIQDIDFTKDPRSRVEGMKLDFLTYYRKNYAIKIRDER